MDYAADHEDFKRSFDLNGYMEMLSTFYDALLDHTEDWPDERMIAAVKSIRRIARDARAAERRAMSGD